MAKLFKIETYVLDYNDDFDKSNIEEYLVYATQRHFNLEHIQIAEVDIGEFYDEHHLNYLDCPKAEFEKYFKEESK
jgi:hypothetical protein